LERFAGVFDLTYTRFLDLTVAETKAHEARIEVAWKEGCKSTCSSEELRCCTSIENEMGLLGVEELEIRYLYSS
jgi:hypothetical protein